AKQAQVSLVKTGGRHVMRLIRHISKCVSHGSPPTTVKARLLNEASHATGKVLRSRIETTEAGKVSVGGNVAVASVDRGAIVHLSVNNNVRLVVTGAGEEVCPPFALIV